MTTFLEVKDPSVSAQALTMQISLSYIKHMYVDLPWKALPKQVLAEMYSIMETKLE